MTGLSLVCSSIAHHTDGVCRAHLPFKWVAQPLTSVLSLCPVICFAVSTRLQFLVWISSQTWGLERSAGFPPPHLAAPGCKVTDFLVNPVCYWMAAFYGRDFPLLLAIWKAFFSTQCDYKADSPCHGLVSTLHVQDYQNLFLQMRMLSRCHLVHKDTLGTFPVLDTREAKLNKIRCRLIEIIFLFWCRVVNLPVTSTILFLLWSLTIFFPLLYGSPCARTSNLKKGLFLPYSWGICRGKGGEGKWALRPRRG